MPRHLVSSPLLRLLTQLLIMTHLPLMQAHEDPTAEEFQSIKHLFTQVKSSQATTRFKNVDIDHMVWKCLHYRSLYGDQAPEVFQQELTELVDTKLAPETKNKLILELTQILTINVASTRASSSSSSEKQPIAEMSDRALREHVETLATKIRSSLNQTQVLAQHPDFQKLLSVGRMEIARHPVWSRVISQSPSSTSQSQAQTHHRQLATLDHIVGATLFLVLAVVLDLVWSKLVRDELQVGELSKKAVMAVVSLLVLHGLGAVIVPPLKSVVKGLWKGLGHGFRWIKNKLMPARFGPQRRRRRLAQASSTIEEEIAFYEERYGLLSRPSVSYFL